MDSKHLFDWQRKQASGNRHLGFVLGFSLLATLISLPAAGAPAASPTYIAVGDVARTPIGWVQFCGDHPEECQVPALEPRDVRMTSTAWKQLVTINAWVNDHIQPATDLEVYGVVEYWAYPVDRGDCEDYVLLKRRMLMETGWPRQALLITVVRDQHDEGHAILTVRTDQGEFILDNQTSDIVPWYETPYRFVKRQSQSDPNVWVSLGNNRPSTPVTSAGPR